MNEMTFHDFITSSDEFYLYLGFQFVMFLAAFIIGWISGLLWAIRRASKEMTLSKTTEQDWSV